MTQRSQSQKIGSLGHQLAKVEIEKSGNWIARDQNEHFGIDLELELTAPDVSGKIIKAQIKSHNKVKRKGDFIYERLKKSFLRYAHECRIPIILIVVDTASSEIWYIWIQKWLYDTDNTANIYDSISSHSILINISDKYLLKDYLDSKIILIATGENETHKFLILKELANLSLKLYDDKLSDLLFSYIESKYKDKDFEMPDFIINRVLEIGTAIWATNEGNKRARQLFDFIRLYGEKMNVNHVRKLVIRGKDYSRTGINALSILYSEFPLHTVMLALPEHFKKINSSVYYYCRLREKHLGNKSYFWITEVTDFQIENFTIEDPSFLGEIANKIANRGDSAILDYMTSNLI